MVAFLAVGADAAGVGHEDSGFAGDVGAEVPGVGEDEEGGVGDFVDVGDPGLLGLGIGFRRRHAAFAHPGYEVGDEVDVLLDADGHVAEDGGAAGAGDHEHVGEAGDLEAEVGLGALGPLLRVASARSGPRMSIFRKVPVMASKPVAKTMTSNSKSCSDVRMPVAVIS